MSSPRAIVVFAGLVAVGCATPSASEELMQSQPDRAASPSPVRKVLLGAEHAQHATLTRAADGSLRAECVKGRAAAQERVEKSRNTESR